MRVQASISLVAWLCAGCTTVVGTSDFYVVSGGGGAGADGGGGTGNDCADGELALTVTCPSPDDECELDGSIFTGTTSNCFNGEAILKVDCANGDAFFIGCTDTNGPDTCVITGSGAKTVTVSCVDDG